MCTVTYLPNNNGDFIFTSSRDEEVQRKTLAPEIYTKDETRFVYPKDLVGGGTWIATSDQERLVCLLNGAYEAHDKKKTSEKSKLSRLFEDNCSTSFFKSYPKYPKI